MIAIAGDLRVLASLVDECMEEEAGVARMTDTGRGLGESPEGDLDPAPNPHRHEKPSTQHRLPATPRKCDGHTPHPAPGPGPDQDHAPAHVLGPDPGLAASREDAREAVALPFYPSLCQMHRSWFICQEMFVLT